MKRLPIPFHAIAAATGVTRGTICRSYLLGWHIRVDGDALETVELPAEFVPQTEPGETVRIENNEWVIEP